MASATWLQHAAARTTMRRRAGQRPHDETRSWLLPFSTAADLRRFCAAETLLRLDYAVSERASIVGGGRGVDHRALLLLPGRLVLGSGGFAFAGFPGTGSGSGPRVSDALSAFANAASPLTRSIHASS